jgi:hypothetical protein
MEQRELYIAITGTSENRVSWTLGSHVQKDIIVLLEYNLTFMCVDIYLDDGRLVRNFDVRELIYRPKDAEKESISDHETAAPGFEVAQLN